MSKTTNTRLIDFLKNRNTKIVVLAAILVHQIHATMDVYSDNNDQDWGWWFGLLYAVAIDTSILIFVADGRKRLSQFYLVVMCVIVYIAKALPPGTLSGQLFMGWVGPMTVYFYSEFFESDKEKTSQESVEQPQLSTEQAQASALVALGIRIEAQPYKCPECGECAASSKKLNGHISGHKMKQKWFPESYGQWEAQNERRAAEVIRIEAETSMGNGKEIRDAA